MCETEKIFNRGGELLLINKRCKENEACEVRQAHSPECEEIQLPGQPSKQLQCIHCNKPENCIFPTGKLSYVILTFINT